MCVSRIFIFFQNIIKFFQRLVIFLTVYVYISKENLAPQQDIIVFAVLYDSVKILLGGGIL